MSCREFEHFLSLEGHKGSVISLAATADHQTLVSSSADKTIKIWNLPTGKLQKTLEGHRDYVNQVLISKDDQTLVSSGLDKTINVWHLPTGKLKRTLDCGEVRYGHRIVLSPCDRYITGGGDDGVVRVWELATGKLQQTWVPRDPRRWKGTVPSFLLTTDGKTAITTTNSDYTIQVWEVPSGQLIRTMTGHTSTVISIALSSDENFLVSGSWDESVRIWDWKTGEQKQQLGGYPGKVPTGPIHPTYGTTPTKPTVRCVAISSNGETIFSGDELSQINIWDRPSGKKQQLLKQRYGNVLGLLLINENTFATGGEHSVHLYSNTGNDVVLRTS